MKAGTTRVTHTHIHTHVLVECIHLQEMEATCKNVSISTLMHLQIPLHLGTFHQQKKKGVKKRVRKKRKKCLPELFIILK